jgi:galactan 5-O-arabinofuranosyltransferase
MTTQASTTSAAPDAAAAEAEGGPGATPASSQSDRPRLLMPRLLMPWLLVPVAVALAYLVLPPPSVMRSQYQASAVALVSAPVIAWLITRGTALAHSTAAALVAALLPGLTLISLNGSDWFFNGPFGDQSFRVEYATRFTDDLSLQDYTYKDVPAFYSPGWFWVVGLSARLAGTDGWQAYKWVGIASLYLAAAAAFWLWRRTCGTQLSALLLAVTTIGLPAAGASWLGRETLLFAGAYEPYAWLVVLPLPALLTWFGTVRGPFTWRRGVLLGAVIALAAWLYILYALVTALAVVIVAVWRWRDRDRLKEVAVAGVTSIVLVSPWLGPFLVAWIAAGTPTAVAMTYVNSDSYVHLVGTAATPWVLLPMLGAVALLALDADRHRRLRGLQAMALTVVLLGAVQILAGQAAKGVLFHRLMVVLGVALLAAGTLALAAVAPHLLARLRSSAPGLPLRRLGLAVLTVLLFLNVSAHGREWMNMDGDLRKLAQDVSYPDGTFPALVSESTREALSDDVPVTVLAGTIRATAREAGQEETGVVLTDNIALMVTEPFYGYQQWWGLYAHPLGKYSERRDFLEDLEDRPVDEIVDRLRSNPDAPTVLALQRNDDGDLSYGSFEWNPGDPRHGAWSVSLPEELVESEEFVTTTEGDWVVAALREQ